MLFLYCCLLTFQILNSAVEVNSLLMMNDVNQFLYDRVQDDLRRPGKLNDFEKKLLDTLKGTDLVFGTRE